MQEWFAPAEIAKRALPGLPKKPRGVQKLATREGWDAAACDRGAPLSRPRRGRGGGREYHYTLFPRAAQVALVAEAHKLELPATAKDVGDADAGEPEGKTPVRALRRDAKLAILSAFDAYRLKSDLGMKAAEYQFSLLYNRGEIEAVPDWARKATRSVSPASLARWRKLRRNGETGALAGNYTGRKGASVLDRAEGGKVNDCIAALIVRQPHLTADHVRDIVCDRFGDELEVRGEDGAIKRYPLPPLRAFQRHISKWKAKHENTLLRLTEPDGFKSRRRVAGSNMNGWVQSLNQLWEIDASPADVLLLDGRYNIYSVVDIWSRRMMVAVTRTPKTQAVLLLLRRAIMEWGVPEILRTDNGSDFVSFDFKRAMSVLAIAQDVCDPAAPEQKGTVERHIGTLQRGLMPLLPGFIGHNVADRKQIEARKSFAQRLGESPEKAFCVDLTADELQDRVDRWCEMKYAHGAHKGLAGETPFNKAASWTGSVRRIKNERALDILLAPVAGRDGLRQVGKQGIAFDGAFFLHPDLEPGETVFCRQDTADMGRLWVFSEDQATFLCVAECPERLGQNPAEMVARVKAAQRQRMDAEVKPLQAEIRRIKPRDMIDSVLRTADRNAGSLHTFPATGVSHETPELKAAETAGRNSELPAPREKTSREKAAHEAVVAKLSEYRPAPKKETGRDRFVRWLDLDKRISAGEAVSDEDRNFWRSYPASAEYRTQRRMDEDFGLSVGA